MMLLLKLSWRSIWRHRRRTLLTAGSTATAVALAVWFLAIANGMYGNLLYEVLRLQAGHLTIENARHLDTPSVDLRLTDVPALRSRVGALPGVNTTKVLVVGQAVASSGDGAIGVSVTGVEPSVEAAVSPLPRRLIEGAYLADTDERSVVIGAELARQLDVPVGGKLVLSSNDVRGQLAQELVRVKGIFRTGSVELDAYYVQVPIAFARRLFGMAPTEATQLGIVLDDPDAQAAVSQRVAALLSPAAQARVWPWQRVLPELSTFMRVDKGSNYVLQVIVLLLALFTVFNTVLMSALERKREFSVMLALGTPPQRLRAQLLVESTLLGVVGATVGVLLGCGIALATHGIDMTSAMGEGFEVGGFLVDPILRTQLSLRTTVGVGAAVVVAIALMSLVPASRIGALRITDAFR